MKIEAIDKQVSFEHKGKVYQNNDGVIDVPDGVGKKFVEASNTGKRDFCGEYKQSYSLGSSLSDDQWERIFGKRGV